MKCCHAAPCKYPAGQCPLHELPRVGVAISGSRISVGGVRPDWRTLGGHGGEIITDVLCCKGCGYAICACPPDPPGMTDKDWEIVDETAARFYNPILHRSHCSG